MTGINIKCNGRERNKSIKQSMRMTLFLILIVTYHIKIIQTYSLFYKLSTC